MEIKDIKIGDRVKIVNEGEVYDTYESWATKHQLTNWENGFAPYDNNKGTVVCIDFLGSPSSTMLYGVKLDSGKSVIMNRYGIELLEQQVTKTSVVNTNDPFPTLREFLW